MGSSEGLTLKGQLLICLEEKEVKVQRKMAPKMREGSQIVESHVASEMQLKTKLREKGKTARR